ncbi:MAG: PAS domain S-box protein [Planctomycetes bacterium]|nr:PAS domain S-box protein [Planctomycetota bacterium]
MAKTGARVDLPSRGTLFAAVGALSVLIVLGVAYSLVVFRTLRTQATRETLAADRVQAESASRFIADHQEGLVSLLEVIASRPSLRAALPSRDEATLHPFLQPLSDLGRQVAVAWLADLDGTLLAILPAGATLAGPAVSPPAADRRISDLLGSGGEGRIRISVPVVVDDGSPRAVLGIDQPAAFWEEFLQRLISRPGRSYFLFDREGGLVAAALAGASLPAEILASLARGLLSAEAAAQGSRALITATADGGVRAFGAAAPVPDAGWTVVVLHEYEAAMAPARTLFRSLLLFLSLLLLSVFLLSLLLYQRYRTQQRLLWQLDQQARSLETEVRARTADLAATSARYRDLVEDLPDIVYELDEAGRFTFVSRTVEAVLGFPPADLLGKTHREFVGAEDRERFDSFRTGLTEGQPMSILALRYATASGGRRWLSVHSRGLFDAQGRLRGRRGVARDVTQQVLAEKRIHELSGKLINAQEEERKRLALDLHDETGQLLSALKLGLQALARSRPEAAAELERQIQLTQQAMDRTRTLAYNLRPAILDNFGLVPALEDLCDTLADSGRLKVDYSLQEVDESLLLPNVRTTLFRFVQEALTNVVRHSGSGRAEVRLVSGEAQVLVEVRDFGGGFDVGQALDPASDPRRLGLVGMRERLNLVSGRLSIESSPGLTVLKAEVDLGGAA